MQTSSLDITITSIPAPDVSTYKGKPFTYQRFSGFQHDMDEHFTPTPFQLREKHIAQIAQFAEGDSARVFFYITPWGNKEGKPAGVFLNVFKMEKIDSPSKEIKRVRTEDPDRKYSTNTPA
jgi:hypothetical protein